MAKHSPYRNLISPAGVEAVMSPDAGPGVIDLWAPWCVPCKAMAPHFEAVATEYADRGVGFYKIDTEAHPQLGNAFHVRSIPTLLFVNHGEIVDVHVGTMDGARLAKKVEWLVARAEGRGLLARLFGRRKDSAA